MSDARGVTFRWEDVDQRLVSPKTLEISREMHKRAAVGERRIADGTAGTGNSAGYLPRLFDFHEQLTDEWIEREYAAYCEARMQQNRQLCPEFIRALRDGPIAQLMAARRSSVLAEVGRRAAQIGEQSNPYSLEDWERKMGRLKARWNRRLEAEAVAAEYRVTKSLESTRIHSSSLQGESLEQVDLTSAALRHAAAQNKRREAIINKVQNPQSYTIVSIEEAALYFGVRPRTIYRWNDEGKLKRGGRRGSIMIESIRRWQNKRSRKRQAR
jgi:Helix-turn-helix domain